MSKITLNNVGSLIDATTAQATINSNNATIQAAFDNTLSRDGEIPNQMNASFDMNSNRIINLGAPLSATDAVRFQDLSSGTIPHVGTLGLQNANAVNITGGTIAGTTITGSTINGITPGTIASQNSNAVNITGGTITGTNLGSMAIQNSGAVAITGGSITGTNLSNSTINPDAFGADPTGVNPSDTAINAAIASGTQIYMTAGGTYRLTGSIKMKPNVRLNGNGATITQSAGTNLLIFFDFQTFTANNSQVDNCIVDGNSANNTNASSALFAVTNANNVKIASNIIKNSTGGGVALNTSNGSIVQGNNISNCPNYGVAVIGTTAGFVADAQVKDNIITGPYFHGIQVTQATYVNISGNIVNAAAAIGDISAPLRVNTSGAAVTWVSGPTFAAAKAGTIFIINGGAEGIIQSVNSSTSITLTSPIGTFTNFLAAIGSGDVISITNASYVRIIGNQIFGGITGGVVIANTGGSFASTDSSLANSITGNTISTSGQFGIACEAFVVTGNPVVNDLAISGNMIINPGRIGSSVGAPPLGIQLSSATGLMTNVAIAGNALHDYASVTGGYWLGKSGTAGATNVTYAGNSNVGFANGTLPNGY